MNFITMVEDIQYYRYLSLAITPMRKWLYSMMKVTNDEQVQKRIGKISMFLFDSHWQLLHLLLLLELLKTCFIFFRHYSIRQHHLISIYPKLLLPFGS